MIVTVGSSITVGYFTKSNENRVTFEAAAKGIDYIYLTVMEQVSLKMIFSNRLRSRAWLLASSSL